MTALRRSLYLTTLLRDGARVVSWDVAEPLGQAIERDLGARDARDKGRAAAPLRRAEDAVLIDTTEKDFDEVVDYITAVVQAGEGRPAG